VFVLRDCLLASVCITKYIVTGTNLLYIFFKFLILAKRVMSDDDQCCSWLLDANFRLPRALGSRVSRAPPCLARRKYLARCRSRHTEVTPSRSWPEGSNTAPKGWNVSTYRIFSIFNVVNIIISIGIFLATSPRVVTQKLIISRPRTIESWTYI